MGLICIWTISRYLSYMEKYGGKLNYNQSVATFPDIAHIWRKYGRKIKKQQVSDHPQMLPIYGENMEENEETFIIVPLCIDMQVFMQPGLL